MHNLHLVRSYCSYSTLYIPIVVMKTCIALHALLRFIHFMLSQMVLSNVMIFVGLQVSLIQHHTLLIHLDWHIDDFIDKGIGINVRVMGHVKSQSINKMSNITIFRLCISHYQYYNACVSASTSHYMSQISYQILIWLITTNHD